MSLRNDDTGRDVQCVDDLKLHRDVFTEISVPDSGTHICRGEHARLYSDG
jgi:hypothetical protein